MAVKVLGQAVGAGTTLVDLYAPAVGKTAVVSTLMCANTDTVPRTIQVRVRRYVSGAVEAEATKQVIIPTRRLAAGEPFPITIGIALGAQDTLSVRGETSAVAFTAFGSEN